MAEIQTRKRGNKWEYRFESAKISGKRKQITKSGFKTKKEALEAGIKALSEYNECGICFTPSEMSFSDYLDVWMKEYCEVNLKSTTVDNYQKQIRLRIRPNLGMYKLSALSPVALQNFINKMFNEGYSRNTLNSLRHILSGSLNYATNTLQVIQYNPMTRVKLPSNRAVPDNPTRLSPHVYIPQDKIKKIFERFPEGSSPYIPMQFGYKCGMRLGEAFAVCWDDVDLENHSIDINKQVQWDKVKKCWYFTNPKYDSFRIIEIDNELCEILKREYDKQQNARIYYDDLYTTLYEDMTRCINTNGDGKIIHPVAVRENGEFIVPRTMQHTSGIIHHQLGFEDFTFHSFRHTHATMLAESDAPIKYVQERLGHKDANVTMRIYQHITDNLRQNGNEILEKMYSDNAS